MDAIRKFLDEYEIVAEPQLADPRFVPISFVPTNSPNSPNSQLDPQIHFDDIDRSLDLNKLPQLLDCFDPTVQKIVREIIEQTQYISFKRFVVEIQSIAKKININEFSIYIDIKDPCHSEVWCIALVWHIIKNHVKNIFTSIDQITNEYPILLIDDCIYSGAEMCDKIRKINNNISGSVNCYITAPYGSAAISILFRGMLNGTLIKEESRIYTNLDKLSLTYLIGNYIQPFKSKSNNGYYSWELLNRYTDTSPACLPIYFDHKIADSGSSFPAIYNFLAKARPNRNPILALDKLKQLC